MKLARSLGVVLSVGVLIGVAAGPAQANKRITEYPVPTPYSEPGGIASGPDGNLWFTEYQGNKIGRVTPSGNVKEVLTPTPESVPRGITAGPRRTVWFVEQSAGKIGAILLP